GGKGGVEARGAWADQVGVDNMIGSFRSSEARSTDQGGNQGWEVVAKKYRGGGDKSPERKGSSGGHRQDTEKKSRKIFGKGVSGALAAGVQIVKKYVCHVDNMQADCEPDTISE